MTLDPDQQAAFDYTFPLYEMARTRYLSVELPANPNRGINKIGHRRLLTDHTMRGVTTPNNDTLYSSAWLDLSGGPVQIKIPKISQRYWSFHFMDAYSSTLSVLGSRNEGEGDLPVWVLHAQDTRPVPAGVRAVRMPTRDVWLIVRILVHDQADAKTVHVLQDGIALQAVDAAVSQSNPLANPVAPANLRGSPTDGANYLDVVNSMLARNPVPADAALLAPWRKWDVLPGGKATAAMATAWTLALPVLNSTLTGGFDASGHVKQGWVYPNDAVGVYGANHRLRANVALGGLGALPSYEAVYLRANGDQTGQPLQANQRYRVRFGKDDLGPVAFWSLSMYQVEPDGRLFFADNAIRRYIVSDRTQGLVKNADGSLDIIVQAAEPASAKDRANWLPAPANSPTGEMRITLRAYLPSPALREGKAPLPQIEKLN